MPGRDLNAGIGQAGDDQNGRQSGSDAQQEIRLGSIPEQPPELSRSRGGHPRIASPQNRQDYADGDPCHDPQDDLVIRHAHSPLSVQCAVSPISSLPPGRPASIPGGETAWAMLRAGFYTLASNQSTAPGWFFAFAGPLGPQPAGAQNRPPWTQSSAGVSVGP